MPTIHVTIPQYLYHATLKENSSAIEEKGLMRTDGGLFRKRSHTTNFDDSNKKSVYLGSVDVCFYMMSAYLHMNRKYEITSQKDPMNWIKSQTVLYRIDRKDLNKKYLTVDKGATGMTRYDESYVSYAYSRDIPARLLRRVEWPAGDLAGDVPGWMWS